VPIADSALLSAKIIKDAKLVVIKGAPHGMCTTLKDRVNGKNRLALLPISVSEAGIWTRQLFLAGIEKRGHFFSDDCCAKNSPKWPIWQHLS
jgi:hypothetical protein